MAVIIGTNLIDPHWEMQLFKIKDIDIVFTQREPGWDKIQGWLYFIMNLVDMQLG